MSDPESLDDILGDLFEQRASRAPEDLLRAHPELRQHLDALDEMERALAPGAPDGVEPRVLGDFRILREVGRGGMGVVYEAEQISLRRRVALKVLHPGVALDERAVRRFRAEARTAGRVHHTNLVPVYAMGEDGGTSWFAMELVEGRTLDAVVEDLRRIGSGRSRDSGAPSTVGSAADGQEFYARIARLFAAVAEALAAAHAAGVVHRDVKPSNLILGPDGVLKLTDFGLAFTSTDRSFATVTGGLVGTPVYMSPEQATGAPVDGRTDVYSLGATLYEVLTLRPHVRNGELADVAYRIRTSLPVEPRRVDRRVPRDLETIVLKALEKDPARRYATAAAMAEDLRSFAEGFAVRARRMGLGGRLARRVRRHKVVSALLACVALLGTSGGFLAVRVERERIARTRLEYGRLVEQAWRASVLGLGDPGPAAEGRPAPWDMGAALFARAVELDPTRADAWLGRALAPGAAGRRFADLDHARARGLGDRTYHLTRAAVHLESGSPRSSASDESRAREAPGPAAPLDLLLEGQLLAARCANDEALSRLTEAADRSPAGSPVWTRALLGRAALWERSGEVWRAFEDLSSAVGNHEFVRPGLRVRLALLTARVDQPDRAEACFGETLREVRDANDPRLWIDLCRACSVERGNPRWREAATSEAARLHPDDPVLGVLRSDALGAQGRAQAGLDLVDRLLERNAGNSLLATARAARLLQLGRAQEALAALDTSGDAGGGRGRSIRAEALRRLRRPQEALVIVDAAVAESPFEPDQHSLRGVILCDDLRRPDEAVEAFRAAIRLEPGRASFRRNLGVAEWKRGRPDEAVEALREAVRVDRDFAPAWGLLGFYLSRRGDRAGAIEAHRRAVGIDPGAHDDWLALGNLLSDSDLPAAADAIRAAIRARPDSVAAHYNLGNTWKAMGRGAEAIGEYEQALALDASHAAAWTNLGIAREDAGDASGAEAAYREATRRKPDLPNPRVQLGMLCLKSGRWEEAVEVFRGCLGVHPDHPEALFGWARALRGLKRLEEAEAVLSNAVRLAPDASRYVERGNLLDEMGRTKEALEAYAKALEIDPSYATSHYERGILWRDRGDHARAVEEVRQAARVEPSRELFRYELGCLLVRVGGFEEAIGHLRAACTLCPDHAEAHHSLGVALSRREQWAEARAAFQDAIARRPSYAIAHRNLGLALDALGRQSDALDVLDHAARLDPADPDASRYAGDIHRAAGRFQAALHAYEEWSRRAARDPEALRAAADCLTELGRFDEAIERYRKAAGLEPENLCPEVSIADLLIGRGGYLAAVESCDAAMARLGPVPSLLRPKVTALRALSDAEGARRVARAATEGVAPPADALLDFAQLCAVAGDRARAEAILAGDPGGSALAMYRRARVHAVLGDTDAAVEWLEKAIGGGCRRHGDLAPDPEFAPLQGHPGFRDAHARLLRR